MTVDPQKDVKTVDEDARVYVEDTTLKRTANWLDVMYHSVTAMVGAGVLGLPAVFGHLGWAGGLIFLGFSLWVSWYTYKLLVYMHEVPDLDSKEQPGQTTGGIRRLDRYDQVADYVLGKPRGRRILLPFQIAVLMGMATTYTVVGGDSLHSFARHLDHEMSVPRWAFYIFFGGLQMLLSLLPSFNELSLVSLLGALMSVSYCTIAVAMSGTAAPAPGSVNYNPAAVERSDLARAMGVFNALTSILFAYGGHNVAVEIQATIPVNQKHPSTIPPMMKGVNVTFIITGLAYFAVAIMGFWAFGTSVADNVLLSFNGGPHSWVVAMADIMVVVHVASAYQVYTQPVFQLIEDSIKARTGAARVNPAIAAPIRVLYAALITVIGVVIPFFGSLMGFVGAIAITPTTFLLPPLLWLLYKRPARWSIDWTVNWFLVIVTSVVGVLGTVGSLYGIVTAWKTYKIFAV